MKRKVFVQHENLAGSVYIYYIFILFLFCQTTITYINIRRMVVTRMVTLKSGLDLRFQ